MLAEKNWEFSYKLKVFFKTFFHLQQELFTLLGLSTAQTQLAQLMQLKQIKSSKGKMHNKEEEKYGFTKLVAH